MFLTCLFIVDHGIVPLLMRFINLLQESGETKEIKSMVETRLFMGKTRVSIRTAQ